MTDIIANEDERRWDMDRTEVYAEPEWREDAGDRNVPWKPDPTERKTATARWENSVLIIATLSALSWAAIVLLVIAGLSTL